MSIKRKLVAAVIGAAVFCGTATAAPASTAVRSAAIAATVEGNHRIGGYATILYTGTVVQTGGDSDWVTLDASCTVTDPLFSSIAWTTAECAIVDLTTGSRWLLNDLTPNTWWFTYEAEAVFTGPASRDYMFCIQGADFTRLYEERCTPIDGSVT